MKKLLMVILFALALFIPISYVQAEEPISQVSSETVSLIDKGKVGFSNVSLDMSNYMSVGYQTLIMGSSTTYTIDLTNVLQFLDHYNVSNVSNVYIQFDLEAVYTGVTQAEYQWLSSNVDWDSATERINLGTTIPTSVTAEVWWNVIGQSGGGPSTTTGSLRVSTIKFVIEYSVPVELYTQLNDWTELPTGDKPLNDYVSYAEFETTGNMIAVEMDDLGNGTHDIYFDFSDVNRYVAKGVTLPSVVTDKTIKLARFFATSDAKFLWFFYDIDSSNPYNSDFLIWNLLTGEFREIITGTVYGMPYATGDGISAYNMLYTDLVIPWEIESIVSVKMSYSFRYHYLVGGYGDWQTVTSQDLFEGAKTDVDSPWWNPFARLYYDVWFENSIGTLWEFDQIVDVTTEYDADKKALFTNYINEQAELNLAMADIFPVGSTVAQIFLGQKDKFGSNGVEAKDVVLLEIRYVSDGVEYSSVYPDQIIPDPDSTFSEEPDFLTTLFNEFWKLASALYIIFCLIVGFIATKFTFWALPVKYSGKPWIYVLLVLGFAFVIYSSYKPPTLG